MGEAKRRRTKRDIATDLTKELTEKGKLIEAGFAALASMAISKDAPAIQLSEMQLAFMAGAEHVWSSVMMMLDPEDEPTEDDFRRMSLIEKELDEWRDKISERVNQPKERQPDPVRQSYLPDHRPRDTPAPPSSREHFYQQQPHERLGDAPIPQQQHEQMVAVMQTIDEFVNAGAKGDARKTGIVLLMMPFGDTSGRCNFMSNGIDRRDIVTLFKEMIARFEGQPEMSGRA